MGNCCAVDLESILIEKPILKISYFYNGRIKITNKAIININENILKKEFNIVKFDKINTEDDSIYKGELRKIMYNENLFDYVDKNNEKWIMHGKGNYLMPYNYSFMGNFNHGYPNGEGKIFNDNNKLVCKGNFKDDYLDGYGEEYTKYYNYKGNYIMGFKEGHGIYNDIILNLKYIGNFKNNIFHGDGELIHENYKIIGNWSQGKLIDYKFK